jgi:hypothetical protein
MDKSKTPPIHLGSCRFLTGCRGVLHLSIIIAILYHQVPNPDLTIRHFSIAVQRSGMFFMSNAAMHAAAVTASRGVPTFCTGDSRAEAQLQWPPPEQLLQIAVLRSFDDDTRWRTAMQKLRIVILGFGTARQKMVLE